jgi:hypothetical protein
MRTPYQGEIMKILKTKSSDLTVGQALKLQLIPLAVFAGGWALFYGYVLGKEKLDERRYQKSMKKSNS